MERGIILVGLNHRTAPLEVRERLAFDNGALAPALDRLRQLAGVAEGVILSTCNRVEVVACGADPHALAAGLPAFLAREHGVSEQLVARHLYSCEGREAIRHLFRVAASLDSMVVGEPQILGQLKEQYALASMMGATGQVLHRCFHKSFSVAKRVRSGTGIAEKAVSVGSAAVELARGIFDNLSDKTAMLVGAGPMGELTARHLLAHGVGSLIVVNRTLDRAVELARVLGGVPAPLDQLGRYLPLADLVVGAAGGESYLLTPVLVQEALKQRRRRPMFLIDLAVPRSFDPTLNAVDGAYLYNVDDLEGVVAENRDARAEEAVRAEALVEAEVDSFWRWLTSLGAVPTIVSLRDRVERIRQLEVDRALGADTAVDPAQRELLERVTRAIVNKILHAPMTALRGSEEREIQYYADAARLLFRFDEPENEDD